MIIKYVTIKNFRGIHQETRFDLGKRFVLLSASNGMGKTTVIDAIEWGLTGSIGRLKAAYELRSTNDTERKSSDNLAGILKNKNAKPKESVFVELGFVLNGQEFTVRREQLKDGLIGVSNTLSVSPKEPGMEIIHNIEESNFYTYHFCDIQKSLNLQATKRESFSDLFKEFITDYSTEETIAANLELFADDLERFIEDLGKQKAQIESEIGTCTAQLKDFQKQPAIISYPSVAIYSGEQLNVQDMTEAELDDQLHRLYDCGYQKVCNLLAPIKLHRQHDQIISQLLNLQKIVTAKKKQIIQALAIVHKHGSVSEAKKKIQVQIARYDKLHVTKDTLNTYAAEIIEIGCTEFTQEFYTQKIKEIDKFKSEIQTLNDDISALTDGNRILATLTFLLSHREELISYKNYKSLDHSPVVCPVCGSETFGELKDEDILLEAQNYANGNKDRVTNKNKEIQSLQQRISKEYEGLVQAACSAIKFAKDSLQEQFSEIDSIEKATLSFFSIASTLLKIDTPVGYQQLADSDYLLNRVKFHREFLLSDDSLRSMTEQYRHLLKCLDFSVDDTDTEDGIFTRVSAAIRSSITLENMFTLDLMANKISSLKSMLNNQKYLTQSGRLQQLTKKEKEINSSCHEYEQLQVKVTSHVAHIRETVTKLKEQEYEAVGPNLCRLYKKLARVDSVQEVRLSHDNGKMALVDENGKNLVNILSNGQLGVFMLSYFFAGLLSRKDTEPCKVYFIDDLTACMDDVNMLSFLDLMKYQMQERSNDNGIDQMFFASCDYRVCELLRYKLSGSHIPYCELSDKSFSGLL